MATMNNFAKRKSLKITHLMKEQDEREKRERVLHNFLIKILLFLSSEKFTLEKKETLFTLETKTQKTSI